MIILNVLVRVQQIGCNRLVEAFGSTEENLKNTLIFYELVEKHTSHSWFRVVPPLNSNQHLEKSVFPTLLRGLASRKPKNPPSEYAARKFYPVLTPGWNGTQATLLREIAYPSVTFLVHSLHTLLA